MWLLFAISFAEIHADAPEFVEMSVEQEILETGIKVVDLLAPYAKGGKIGMRSSHDEIHSSFINRNQFQLWRMHIVASLVVSFLI